MTGLRRTRAMRAAFLLYVAAHSSGFTVSPNNLHHCQRTRRCCCWAHQPEQQDDEPTHSTALCVIPPDEAWDTLQRARHMARDTTYHRWPPAIRLFHPFCPRSQLSNVALEIAQLVEEYDIEPFQVSLDKWTIVPHMEALEADWEAMRQLPKQDHTNGADAEGEPEETEADRLIAEEERIGRQRLLKRSKRSRQRQLVKHGKVVTKTLSEVRHEEQQQQEASSKSQSSPRELLEKQKQMYEEFNGPCVLCLEPDEESRDRLVQLRELLKNELFEAYDKYSPSSSVSNTGSLPRTTEDYRPLVPVASFPSVTSAVEMARKLKGLWDPLSFNVTDFHLISYESDAKKKTDFSDNPEYNLRKASSWLKMAEHEEQSLTVKGQFGCDALVMLMGEQVDVDEEGSQEMVDIIMERGSPGGGDLLEHESDNGVSLPASLAVQNTNGDDDTGNLELWLDEEEDEWDEGTVVVIGRTHFFSGEMRTYTGMPASSTVDAKDRILGDGVHASARRKRTSHRAANLWKEGEFGRRESDFV